jgi:hypothetical protein
LVATEGRIVDIQRVVQGEDRASCIGAISGRSATRDASCYVIVEEGAVTYLDGAAVIEDSAA